MQGVTINLFVPKLHGKQVLEIFKSRPDIFPEHEIVAISEEIQESPKKKHLKMVATEGKRVVGYISALPAYDSKNSWLLGWFAVSKDRQRQGVGSLLMKEILENLNNLKASRLFIETCSCDGERPAREFYQKQGCQQVAVLPDYYTKGHSKVIFLRQINQSEHRPRGKAPKLGFKR